MVAARRLLNYFVALLALVLGAAAWAAEPAKGLGVNLIGERCESQAREDLTSDGVTPVDGVIYCDTRLAGSVMYSRVIGSERKDTEITQAQLLGAFKGSRQERLLNGRMHCEEAKWFVDPAVGTFALLPCQLKSGGWQHVALVSLGKGILLVADAPPTVLPGLLSLIGVSTAQKERLASRAGLSELWGKQVILASASDLERFKQLINEGRAANSILSFAQAEQSFRKALELQTRLLSDSDTAIADTLLDLAVNVSNQGKLDEAQALLRRAEPIVQKSPFEADRARFDFYQGIEAANRGDFATALRFARAATRSWRKIASGDSIQGLLGGGSSSNPELEELALSLQFQAQMELRNDGVVTAGALASEALLLINQSDLVRKAWKADILITLGEVSMAQGRLSAAETYFNSAMVIRKQIFGEGLATIPVHVALGTAYQHESMNTAAIISYREAFKIAKSHPLAGEIFTREQLIPFATAVVDYADTLRDENAKQGLFAEAFDAFQFSRSSMIDKTINQAQARLASDDPLISALVEGLQTAQRQRDVAKGDLALEQALPDSARSGDAEGRLQNAIRAHDQQIASQSRELMTKFPAYSRLANPEPVQLLALRKSLGDKEALVSFIVGRNQSFVQITRRNGNYIGRINQGASGLDETVKALRGALEIQAGSISEFDLGRAHELYKTIFGAVQEQLQGVQHLIIAPAGSLASLPFGLLVTAAPESGGYAQAKWLGQQYAISHIPSMQAFYTLRGAVPKRPPAKTLLAFADPVLVGETSGNSLVRAGIGCRPAGPMDAATLRALAPLPETSAEVGTVAKIIGAKNATIFLREQATEEMFRQQQLDDYRVLYFATHGLLPGELRCQTEPGLVLTPPTQQARDKSQDGLLDASEIAALKLNADIVILSACNTAGGSGKLGGEALSGLAESFLFAGARSLVVSHWQVPSAATTALLSDMFTKLGPELTGGASVALMAAQGKLIAQKTTAHPFFWAAFVVIGDGLASTNVTPKVAAAVAR